MALPDLEKRDPEEADAHGRKTHNAAREEENHEKQEKDVVDREDLAGADQDPLNWIKDLRFSK